MKVAEIITNKIIEELEKGIIPWNKPWTGQGRCINYVSRKSYSFLNEMLLNKPGEYLTFKQVQDKGGKVKKGAKSNIVVFWHIHVVTEKDQNGKEVTKKIPLLRYYNVFHIDQTEGIESKLTGNEKQFIPVENAENDVVAYFEKYGIKFNHVAGDKAFYRPSTDEVVLPLKKQFKNEPSYYEVLFHETIHSTGHKSRLNRLSDIAAFGSHEYSKEELVAEIGASIMGNLYGIENPETFKNNVAYIQSWLGVLKNDKNFIISASSKAQKAVEMIQGKSVNEEPEEENNRG